MSAFNSQNVMRFHQKFFKEELEDTKKKSSLAVLKEKLNKADRALEKLEDLTNILRSDLYSNDPDITETLDKMDNFSFKMRKVLKSIKKENIMKDQKNETQIYVLTQDCSEEKIENERQKSEEVNEQGNVEEKQQDDLKSLQKFERQLSKSLIIKTEYTKRFLLQILFRLRNIPIKVMSLMNENTIFVSFENNQDCKNFKQKMENCYPEIKIFEEENKNVGIIIDEVKDMLAEEAEKTIVEITSEVPYEIAVVAKGEKEHWVIYAEISSSAYLKLQAHNEFIINIGGLPCQYYLFSEDEIYW